MERDDGGRFSRPSPERRYYSRSGSPFRRRSPDGRRYDDNKWGRNSRESRRGRDGEKSFGNPQRNLNPSSVVGCFGLSPDTEESDLRKVFDKFGKLENVKIIRDKKTDKSKGYGFIYFENIDDAAEALKNSQSQNINGNIIRLDYSFEKEKKPTSRFRGGSRN
jgi:transformer-2 protein